jgi:hypothetical protein
MDTVTITAKKRIVARELRPILGLQWEVQESAHEGLVVIGPLGRVYIYNESVPESPESHCLVLNYSDVDLVKKVIEAVADDPEVIVENDFGTALAGNEFVARLKSEPTWEWRV